MKYLKDPPMVCLEMNEFINFYRTDKSIRLIGEVHKRGLTLEQVGHDNDEMQNVVNSVVASDFKHKEQVELFTAVTFTGKHFPQGSLVCIPVKSSFNFRRDSIRSLEDLRSVMKEGTLTDFAITIKNRLHHYQLKQYKGRLEMEDFLSFLEKQLEKYGNDIGKVNLLILMQGNGSSTMNIDFKILHQRVQSLGLKFDGHIFIMYTEIGKEGNIEVVNQIYPDLKTDRKEIDPKYIAGEFMYS